MLGLFFPKRAKRQKLTKIEGGMNKYIVKGMPPVVAKNALGAADIYANVLAKRVYGSRATGLVFQIGSYHSRGCECMAHIFDISGEKSDSDIKIKFALNEEK
jgi:hypothetical protein